MDAAKYWAFLARPSCLRQIRLLGRDPPVAEERGYVGTAFMAVRVSGARKGLPYMRSLSLARSRTIWFGMILGFGPPEADFRFASTKNLLGKSLKGIRTTALHRTVQGTDPRALCAPAEISAEY